MTWQFIIAGLGVGLLVGMTGMGGGSLMTPMLILIFGFDAKTAVGTDILHGAVFKSFGAIRHRQLGNVHVPLAAWMLLGSAPLSLVGVTIASRFSDSTTSAMSVVVGATLIAGGFGFLIKTFIHGTIEDRPFHMGRRDKVLAILILLFGFNPKTAVGTDILHGAVFKSFGAIRHRQLGNVHARLAFWMLAARRRSHSSGCRSAARSPTRRTRRWARSSVAPSSPVASASR
jgi:uncharacterized membrane protein YfcA